MTGKQIKQALESIHGKYFKDMTPEEIKLRHEISCREMINSCLAYGDKFLGKFDKDYIERLGKERVEELYNEQKEDIEKSIILYEMYEDREGGTYNTIKWWDE